MNSLELDFLPGQSLGPSKPSRVTTSNNYGKREVEDSGRTTPVKHRGKEQEDDPSVDARDNEAQETARVSSEEKEAVDPLKASGSVPVPTRTDVNGIYVRDGPQSSETVQSVRVKEDRTHSEQLLYFNNLVLKLQPNEDLEKRAGSPLASQIPWEIANFKFSNDLNSHSSNKESSSSSKPTKSTKEGTNREPLENPYGINPYEHYNLKGSVHTPYPQQPYSPFSGPWNPYAYSGYSTPYPSWSPYSAPTYPSYNNLYSWGAPPTNYNPWFNKGTHYSSYPSHSQHNELEPTETKKSGSYPKSNDSQYEAIRKELLKAAASESKGSSSSNPVSSKLASSFSGQGPPTTPFDTMLSSYAQGQSWPYSTTWPATPSSYPQYNPYSSYGYNPYPSYGENPYTRGGYMQPMMPPAPAPAPNPYADYMKMMSTMYSSYANSYSRYPPPESSSSPYMMEYALRNGVPPYGRGPYPSFSKTGTSYPWGMYQQPYYPHNYYNYYF